MCCLTCKTIEKQDVFHERAMDGESVFYKSGSTYSLPLDTCAAVGAGFNQNCVIK